MTLFLTVLNIVFIHFDYDCNIIKEVFCQHATECALRSEGDNTPKLKNWVAECLERAHALNPGETLSDYFERREIEELFCDSGLDMEQIATFMNIINS